MSGDPDLEAAEYVLGTLDASAREAFNARLLRDKAARAAVTAWESRLSGLSEDIVPVPPPSHVWTKLERNLLSQGAAGRRFRVI
jgi:anti-sigma-K factor RskA